MYLTKEIAEKAAHGLDVEISDKSYYHVSPASSGGFWVSKIRKKRGHEISDQEVFSERYIPAPSGWDDYDFIPESWDDGSP